MTNEVRTIVVGVVSAAIVGMGSAYLTAQTTLTRVEVDQSHIRERVERLERDYSDVQISLQETVIELRVQNERLKKVDDVHAVVRRLEDRE